MSSHDSSPVRRYELLRYMLGELNDAERAAIDARLDREPGGRARLEALEREHTDYLDGVDLALESSRILERSESVEPRRSWGLAGSLAAASLGVLLLGPFALRSLTEETSPANRIKGSAVGLEMYVKAGEEIRRADDGDALRPGDQIQFRYRAGGYGRLIVVSVDGRRVVSPLYPSEVGQSITVDPDGAHVLEGSIILDDALGPERVFAVFSAEPVSFEEVREAIDRVSSEGQPLERVEALPLGRDDVAQATVLFLKRDP